jgi:sulfatase modifying factor 1
MKKTFCISCIIALFFLMFLFNCQQPGGSSGGGGHQDKDNSNPFAGIFYQEIISITGGAYIQTDDGTTNPGHGFNHIISNFSIGKYEVTYELWYAVHNWALSNGYIFANPGIEGNDGTEGAVPTTAKYEPVTFISWRDAIVWCNAYSEMSGLTPCYTYSSSVIKNSTDGNATACDNAVCDWSANGYRLPTEGEWQYAASNKGITPYNYASGATTYYNDNTNGSGQPGKSANDTVAVYGYYWDGSNWVSTGVAKTANTGIKTANALWINDMSGNVWEWCWDWYGSYPSGAQTDWTQPVSGSFRTKRGGSWYENAGNLQVGARLSSSPHMTLSSTGFRVARTM